MTHQVVIIKSTSVPAQTTTAAADAEPEFSVTVEYRPAHGMTASQIGNEVARIQRRVNQIIEGAPD
jgi:hypothetical protein